MLGLLLYTWQITKIIRQSSFNLFHFSSKIICMYYVNNFLIKKHYQLQNKSLFFLINKHNFESVIWLRTAPVTISRLVASVNQTTQPTTPDRSTKLLWPNNIKTCNIVILHTTWLSQDPTFKTIPTPEVTKSHFNINFHCTNILYVIIYSPYTWLYICNICRPQTSL